MRWLGTLLAGSMLALATTLDAQAASHGYRPANGFVPDSMTAVRIAEAIWTPIYSAKQIRNERPYRAVLHRGVWTVTGTLPPSTAGGVALAEIAQLDGRILRVSHGR